jgi:hypothetical protein
VEQATLKTGRFYNGEQVLEVSLEGDTLTIKDSSRHMTKTVEVWGEHFDVNSLSSVLAAYDLPRN